MKHSQPQSALDRRRLLVALVALTLVAADSKVLRKHVSDGISAFRNQDFNAAAKAFADADIALPGNAIIEFNRACAEAKVQNRKDARKLFKSAAASKNKSVATAAHYNLGCLEALEARAIFGDAPGEIGKSKREKGLEYLTKAIGHYRDTLAIDPGNKDARRNIEVIRMWLAGMRKQWKERDENTEQKSDKEPLASLVAKLDRQQLDIYRESRILIRRDYESPPSHIQNQDTVLNRLATLRNRIEEDFSPNENEPAQGDASQMAMVKKALTTKVDEIEEVAEQALEAASKHEHEEAVPLQVDVLDRLDELYGNVADLPHLARRAVFIESRVRASVENSTDVEPAEEATTAAEGNTLLERETRVRTMARLLVPKGQQLLEGLKQRQAQQQVQQPLNEGDVQKSGYERSAELAIELGPRVAELTEQTTELLGVRNYKEAAPLHAEIHELLKKIVEPLPREDRSEQEDQEEKGNENLQQADEDKPEEEEDGEDSQDKEDQQGTQEQQQEIRDREEAEAMMRQVRDREQKLKDRKTQIRAMRSKRVRVERDW